MTEEEWLGCTDPTPMLEFVRGKGGERKLRLFACGCCRHIWHLISAMTSRQLAEYAERRADGRDGVEAWTPDAVRREALTSPADQAARHAASACSMGLAVPAGAASLAHDYAGPDDSYRARLVETFGPGVLAELGHPIPLAEADPRGHHAGAHRAAVNAAEFSAVASARTASQGGSIMRYQRALREERAVQASLLRDIFGNPFRSASISPGWLTPTVSNLARCAYDERIMPSGELDPDRLAVLSDSVEEAGCDNDDILTHLRSPGPHVRGCWAVDLILGKS